MDRWITLGPLYTLSLTSFLALYKWKFSNTQPHLVVNAGVRDQVHVFIFIFIHGWGASPSYIEWVLSMLMPTTTLTLPTHSYHHTTLCRMSLVDAGVCDQVHVFISISIRGWEPYHPISSGFCRCWCPQQPWPSAHPSHHHPMSSESC